MTTKTISSLLTILFFLSNLLSAQVYIDGENASVNSNGKLNDNGRTLTWALQGDKVAKPYISGFNRAGGKGIGMLIEGATTGSTSQRTEYCLNACYRINDTSTNAAIKNGDTWYTGFSIQLSNKDWADTSSWFVIYQAQQPRASNGQKGNYPIVGLEFKPGNLLELRGLSGKNGATQNNSSLRWKQKEIFKLKKGIWYDIVFGFKYSPNSNNGWVACWIKTAKETSYKKYSVDNVAIGYSDAPPRILQNKIGMYRNRVNGTNRMFFDEVRFARNFDGAKIPSSNGGQGTNNPPSNGGNNSTPINQIISLRKTGGDKKFITAERNASQLIARAGSVQGWEKFRVESHPLGGVALKALSNNKYVQVPNRDTNKPVRNNGNSKGGWERFIWKSKGNSKVALQSFHSKKWLQAAWNENNGVLRAKGNADKGWETFDWKIESSAKAILDSGKLAIENNPVNNGVLSVLGTSDKDTYVINNMSGQIMQSGNIEANGINVSGLTQGIYIIKLTSEENTLVEKIIIK